MARLRQVDEREAKGEIRRVYHEVRQVLRVSGVGLNFQVWAGFGGFLPELWDELRPKLETRKFEEAADRLRVMAGEIATIGLGSINAAGAARLGESQLFHLRRVLELYHYANPKLLLVTTLVRQALLARPAQPEGLQRREPLTALAGIERGIPASMPPMEMEIDKPALRRTRRLLREIRRAYRLDRVPCEYRTFALWPDYLEMFWEARKLLNHESAATELLTCSEALVTELGFRVAFPEPRVERLGEDFGKVLDATERMEKLLPSLLLDVAFAQSEWKGPAELGLSPYPPRARALLRVVT